MEAPGCGVSVLCHVSPPEEAFLKGRDVHWVPIIRDRSMWAGAFQVCSWFIWRLAGPLTVSALQFVSGFHCKGGNRAPWHRSPLCSVPLLRRGNWGTKCSLAVSDLPFVESKRLGRYGKRRREQELLWLQVGGEEKVWPVLWCKQCLMPHLQATVPCHPNCAVGPLNPLGWHKHLLTCQRAQVCDIYWCTGFPPSLKPPTCGPLSG